MPDLTEYKAEAVLVGQRAFWIIWRAPSANRPPEPHFPLDRIKPPKYI